MTTTLRLNSAAIIAACGNRGGVEKSIAHAAAKAIARAIGGALGVFAGDGCLLVSEWAYAHGTYRAEPTRTRHVMFVEDTDLASQVGAVGIFADLCQSAAAAELQRQIGEAKRRGQPGEPTALDAGFDPRLHRVM